MSVGSNITPKMQPGAIKKHNIFLHRFCLSKWLQNGTPHSGFFDVLGDWDQRYPRKVPRVPPGTPQGPNLIPKSEFLGWFGGLCTMGVMARTCQCSGCVKCSPPCQSRRRTEVQFADYCRQCHRHHLCTRCRCNAIPSTSAEPFCSTCLSTRSSWCSCTGCKVHGGHHENRCPGSKQNGTKFKGYCRRCAPRWQCPTCGTTLPDSEHTVQ